MRFVKGTSIEPSVRKALPKGITALLRGPGVRYRHRGLTSSDVLLASYPRSGNTWSKFMLGQLLSGLEMDFDLVDEVVPDIGSQAVAPRLLPLRGRLLRSHEPYRSSYFPQRVKAIYLVRDGRDVACSFYYAHLRKGWFEGSFEEFLPLWLKGRLDGLGPWHKHVASWLDSPLQLLAVRYESLLEDAAGELARMMDFIGVEKDPTELRRVVDDNTADKMRVKEASSSSLAAGRKRNISVVRKATSGSWREIFTAKDEARFRAAAGHTLLRLGYCAGRDT